MTGHGGWPMTCVLDHDGNPFFAGTYFPDQPRHGSPSFRQVLEALVDAWTNRPDEVARVGAKLREHLNQQAVAGVGRGDPRGPRRRRAGPGARVRPAAWWLRRTPRSSRRRWCSSSCCARGRSRPGRWRPRPWRRWRAAASTTSSAAASRATASTRDWVVPHFEKMLYDNALLLRVYADVGHRRGRLGGRGDRRLPAGRAPHRRGRLRLRAGRRLRGRRGHLLRLDARSS